MVATLRDKAKLTHESLWWFHDGHKAIRVGDWKAVAPIGEPWELYNLANDRDESTDLAIPQAEKLESLTSRWQQQLASFVKLATLDLPQKKNRKAGPEPATQVIKPAQRDAMPKRRQVLLDGTTFRLMDRHAFIMASSKDPTDEVDRPWIFYAPTLSAYPDQAESWMHRQFIDAGIAVAGIDVGEAYGSPKAFPFFEALYDEMVKRGYSKKPAMLGRSRGGLWVSSWAVKHPDRVAAIGGIYPVYDYTTYPGTKRAAPAYGIPADKLQADQALFNPIKQADKLAKARVPVLIIHGKDDQVVPLAENSAALEKTYQANGAGELIKVIKIDGQGHNFWPGFFHCQELVDFLIEKAK